MGALVGCFVEAVVGAFVVAWVGCFVGGGPGFFVVSLCGCTVGCLVGALVGALVSSTATVAAPKVFSLGASQVVLRSWRWSENLGGSVPFSTTPMSVSRVEVRPSYVNRSI